MKKIKSIRQKKGVILDVVSLLHTEPRRGEHIPLTENLQALAHLLASLVDWQSTDDG